MTLTEVKNKLAQECGKNDWKQLLSGQDDFMIESYWEKVAYMYAEAKCHEASQTREMIKMLKRVYNVQSIYPDIHKEIGSLILKAEKI